MLLKISKKTSLILQDIILAESTKLTDNTDKDKVKLSEVFPKMSSLRLLASFPNLKIVSTTAKTIMDTLLRATCLVSEIASTTTIS